MVSGLLFWVHRAPVVPKCKLFALGRYDLKKATQSPEQVASRYCHFFQKCEVVFELLFFSMFRPKLVNYSIYKHETLQSTVCIYKEILFIAEIEMPLVLWRTMKSEVMYQNRVGLFKRLIVHAQVLYKTTLL